MTILHDFEWILRGFGVAIPGNPHYITENKSTGFADHGVDDSLDHVERLHQAGTVMGVQYLEVFEFLRSKLSS